MNRKVTPCTLQSPDPGEQPLDSRTVKLRRRLVEDDEPAPNDSARAISTNCRCSTFNDEAGWATSTSTDQVASSRRASRRSSRQLISPADPAAAG